MCSSLRTVMLSVVQEDFIGNDAVRVRFRRLIRELLDGGTRRNTFTRWEVELLLDIQECQLPERSKNSVLRRYLTAGQRALENGAAMPMKLSDFLRRSR